MREIGYQVRWIQASRAYLRRLSTDGGKHPKYHKTRHSIIYDLEPKEQPLYSIIVGRGHGGAAEAKEKISRGLVSVDGTVTRGTRKRWSTDAVIEISGNALPPVPMLAVYHKPVGVQCTTDDPWGRDSLKELLPRWPFLSSMHPVVRVPVYIIFKSCAVNIYKCIC